MDYLYDETFDGLLTCIYEHYYFQKVSGIYSMFRYQQDLLQAYQIIETDEEKAKKVMSAIKKKISKEAFNHMYNVYLSSNENKESIILKYCVLGFKIGRDLDRLHAHPVVHPIHKISRQVGFEAHRFTGLLRFVEVGNLLYAAIEPDHNILPKIADHFRERFKNENFMIHDTKRNLALAYNKNEWMITDYTLDGPIPISENEKRFQALWKGYFEHISIKSRENKKLQQQFVPKKYRKHLTEFQ